ncbi:hypothetical protein ABPG77_011102 [Micractinium sp. CCAP 211/92]
MARSPAAVAVLAALLASLNLAQAAAVYTGDASSFINSFKNTPAISLPGAELRLVTGNDEAGAGLGLGLANMAALQFTLDPCTILQPHIHPHAELAITVSGAVTHSVVYNNGTLTDVTENTVTNVGSSGFAVFPAGQLHVTQNEGCEKAVVVAVFPVAGIDAYFFPYSEAYLPANTIKSFFSGLVDAGDIWTPVGTAKLDKCSCGRKM